MALLKRELHSAKGPGTNDEDRWHLVFDTDTKRLYVEHEWDRVDGRGGGDAERGTSQLDIPEYLTQGGQTAGHRELWRLLKMLFEVPAEVEQH
jgi:hypothetical protein